MKRNRFNRKINLSKRIDTFLNNIQPEPNTGCWLWVGYINVHGYGAYEWINGDKIQPVGAHRISMLVNKNIPIEITKRGSGLHWDHLCRTRCCVNPQHLELVTAKENNNRGFSASAINKRKTHCINGHEFSEKNTGRDHRGDRFCRICMRKLFKKHASKPEIRIKRLAYMKIYNKLNWKKYR